MLLRCSSHGFLVLSLGLFTIINIYILQTVGTTWVITELIESCTIKTYSKQYSVIAP